MFASSWIRNRLWKFKKFEKRSSLLKPTDPLWSGFSALPLKHFPTEDDWHLFPTFSVAMQRELQLELRRKPVSIKMFIQKSIYCLSACKGDSNKYLLYVNQRGHQILLILISRINNMKCNVHRTETLYKRKKSNGMYLREIKLNFSRNSVCEELISFLH